MSDLALVYNITLFAATRGNICQDGEKSEIVDNFLLVNLLNVSLTESEILPFRLFGMLFCIIIYYCLFQLELN